jgi:hypothetical protein
MRQGREVWAACLILEGNQRHSPASWLNILGEPGLKESAPYAWARSATETKLPDIHRIPLGAGCVSGSMRHATNFVIRLLR